MTSPAAPEATLKLPDDVLTWIEATAGAKVTSSDRIPGGATREGWFVDVAGPGGGTRELFLRFSPTPMPARNAFHHLSTEAAVMKALGDAGTVAVPRILGTHPSREAVLSERMPGATWFYRIRDPAEQVEVAQDFIRNLSNAHRLDPAELGIEQLGPVRSAREIALERIEGIRWRGTAPDGTMDPLLRFTTDWLERNVPDYEWPVVLVQGDTGPGNFMYDNGRVTAVVDWELSHWGDPMDDIAWLSLRTVQDTFTHLPDRLVEYVQLSGHPIDERRVWYYRVFAEATMTTLYPNDGPDSRRPGEEDEDEVTRDIGNGIIYRQLHRRLWLEALAAVMDLRMEPPDMPEPAELAEWHRMYNTVLGSIRTIVPRISDPLASQWTKGVARVVKYLQDLDASGRDFAELESADMSSLLGHRPATLPEGRAELADAVRTGRVPDADYVRYMWNKVLRDDHLMRNASGALHLRHWPPLV
jgi:aminoglycoside phosphotransferase (APT) family kinase protein